jgi:hypothetical protein
VELNRRRKMIVDLSNKEMVEKAREAQEALKNVLYMIERAISRKEWGLAARLESIHDLKAVGKDEMKKVNTFLKTLKTK